MRITAIKQQLKDQNRVSIFLDQKYAFSLTLDQLLDEKLKKDQEIDEAKVGKLIKLSNEGKLRTQALEWVLGRPHSIKEFRDYLYKKKVSKDFIESLVGEFSDKKYLDDHRFGLWFVELRKRKNKSERAISSELYTKGLSPVTIKSVVTEHFGDGGDKDALVLLVNKLRKKTRYSDDNKLISYLLGRGFSYADIKEVMNVDAIDDSF